MITAQHINQLNERLGLPERAVEGQLIDEELYKLLDAILDRLDHLYDRAKLDIR